jgi:hypothetical protein
MTRARALKSVIRHRIAKTGERYTTARRHVLAAETRFAAQTRSAAQTREAAPARRHMVPPGSAPATAPATPSASAPAATSKGGLSDVKARERTGHGLDHWFAVLDAFGAPAKGHTAAARHLHDDHGVDGWYSQGITVAYERARGLRAVNQRTDGAYEVSASKVVAGSTADVVAAFTRPRQRKAWTAGCDSALAAALDAAVKTSGAKGFVIRADRLGRYRYKWNDTTVQLYVVPKGEDTSTVTVAHSKLAGAADVDVRRAQWRAALAALAAHLAARD